MLVRRLLEWSIFIFYWLGFGSFAITVIYFRWLRQEYNINEKLGGWSSVALFVLILVIIYFIVRRLALMLYAKCKVSEKRLVHNMKKEIRALKDETENSNYQTNLVLENEKELRRSKKNKNNMKRGRSLDDLTQHDVRNNSLKTHRSLETILQEEQPQQQRYRLREIRPETAASASHSSIQSYTELPVRYGTPPPAYRTLPREYYDSDEEFVIYNKRLPCRSSKKKRVRSADNVLDIDESKNYELQTSQSLGNIHDNMKASCDTVDSIPRKLRPAPPPPVPTMDNTKRSKSLPRMQNKSKSLQQDDLHYKQPTLHRSHSPLHQQQYTVEVHQPHQNAYRQPQSLKRHSRPDMVKQVLVANTFNQRK